MNIIDDLAYAYGVPTASAIFKHQPEDFIVEEVLGFEPDDEGDHCLLYVEKKLQNTQDLALQIARLAGVKSHAVGFSGLKDKYAVTRQWFSVDLSGKSEPDWQQLNNEQVKVLKNARHKRKLRRGTHRANRFIITLRDVQGDRDDIEQRLNLLPQTGVPNYFTEQRFGIDGGNLEKALHLFRHSTHTRTRNNKEGLYLSAARSYLFNLVLSRRVEDGTWNQALSGDVMNLAGSRSHFKVEEVDDEIRRRIQEQDIHPTGSLWGAGELQTTGQPAAMEHAVADASRELCAGLERFGLKQERRALRLGVQDLHWQWRDGNTLELGFLLTTGSYATAVLRELINYPS